MMTMGLRPCPKASGVSESVATTAIGMARLILSFLSVLLMTWGKSLQVRQRFRQANNIREARLNVEQRPLVGDLRTILDGLADDDRPQLEGLGIGSRGAHAGAGR